MSFYYMNAIPFLHFKYATARLSLKRKENFLGLTFTTHIVNRVYASGFLQPQIQTMPKNQKL